MTEEKITKDTKITEAIKIKPKIAGVLMSKGMHCLGCVIAQGETVGEAAGGHGLNVDELIKELNEV